jgi:hypothetical protein
MENTVTINVKTNNITDHSELNEWILNLYKDTVDLCRTNGLKDYETKTPLICKMNREKFIDLIKDHIDQILEDQ